jgi:hypothetical protein
MEDPLKIYNDILSISNEEGTSDGAKKGWLTRKRGGDGKWEPENWNDDKETKLNEWIDEDQFIKNQTKDIKNMDSTIKALQDFKESGDDYGIRKRDIDNYEEGMHGDYESDTIYKYNVDKKIEGIKKEKQGLEEYNDYMENYFSNIIDKEDELENDLDKELLGFNLGYNGSDIDESLVTDEFSVRDDPNREDNKEYYENMNEWEIDEKIHDKSKWSRDIIRNWSKQGARWDKHDQNQYLPQKTKREYAIKAIKRIEGIHKAKRETLQKNINLVSYLNSLKK